MAVVLVFALVWMRVPKTIEYEVIEIPLPEGFSSFGGMRINDYGMVAGVLKDSKETGDHVFIWDRDEGLKDLGHPDFVTGQTPIQIVDINNKGQLIGQARNEIFPDENQSRYIQRLAGSFFYDPQTGFRMISGLKGFWCPYVLALNDLGQVVGECTRTDHDDVGAEWRIFLWDLESGTRDPNLVRAAVDINNLGHILGSDLRDDFLWSPEEGKRYLKLRPHQLLYHGCLDDLDYVFGLAIDSNSGGDSVVGWNQKQGVHSFIRIERGEREIFPSVRAMSKRMILFEVTFKPFDWFRLVKRDNSVTQIRLYTAGEGISIPKFEIPASTILAINNRGWIVCSKDRRAYVMIPKGKR